MGIGQHDILKVFININFYKHVEINGEKVYNNCGSYEL